MKHGVAILHFYLSPRLGASAVMFSRSFFQKGHLTKRPASTSTSSGIFSEHSGLAIGQRGAKRQPGGKLPMRGTLPGMAESRSAVPWSFGTLAISAFVYGCNGRRNNSFA